MKKQNQISMLALLLCILCSTTFTLSAQDIKLRGRLHMDAFYGIKDADDFSNGFNNRRARLGASGKLTDKWDAMIEVDFADGTLSPNDFRFRRTLGSDGKLWIGQFKVPQGFNELTSSNEITFVERSSANNAFVDARRMGVALEYAREAYGMKGMVYGRALGQRGSLETGDNMPIGTALRVYVAPTIGKGVLHIGGSVAYESLMDTTAVVFRDRPEARDSRGGSVRLIGATVPDASSTFKTGVELFYLNGPFSIEGEFNSVSVSRYTTSNTSFHGFHVQTSYVLKGARGYSKGVAKGVKPDEGDAWEIALRYSQVNLNNDEIMGGEQNNVTLGLNYYANARIRFMANVIMANTDKDINPVLGVLRAQYSF